MTRINWNETFQNLWNHPGEEFLVAELVQNGVAVKRLRDADMEVRTEYQTDRLYNVYARYSPPESRLNFETLEANARLEEELAAEQIAAAREAVAKAEARLRKAQAKLQALLDKEER
jgi:hypothetical protein